MNQKAVILLVLVGVLLSFGCQAEKPGDRAKKLAEANRIEEQTQQDIRERAAAEERKNQDWESTRAAWAAARSTAILIVFISVAVVIAIGGFIVIWRIHRLGLAIQRRADLAARMVRLDAKTGTYPVLILNDALHVLESGAVIPLGLKRDEVPQLVAQSAFTRNLALSSRTAIQIADKTRDSQAGDAFFTAAGALPNPYESREGGPLWQERRTVENSAVIPGALKRAIDRRLQERQAEIINSGKS